MINIRADDDQEPEEVLAQLSLEQRVGAAPACRPRCVGGKCRGARPGVPEMWAKWRGGTDPLSRPVHSTTRLVARLGCRAREMSVVSVAGSGQGACAGGTAPPAIVCWATRPLCPCRGLPACFALQEQLEEMRRDSALYDRLAASVAPNVHGHTDVKRAILLMLLGGMHKQTREVRARLGLPCMRVCRRPAGSAVRSHMPGRVQGGAGGPGTGALQANCCPPALEQGINLRGDINVAIVGDPACAKSQMLK